MSQADGAPQIIFRAGQPYVAIPVQASLREWGRTTALVGEVFAWLGQRGIAPGGPLFYRYWVIGDMERPFTLEVGVPLGSAVPGDGRVIAGAIPAGTYATLLHHGHPDRLLGSLTALERWAAGQGLAWANHREGADEVWGGRFEFYLTDPAEQPDLEQWQTEIAYLLSDGAGATVAPPDEAAPAVDLPPGIGRPAHGALVHAGYLRLEQLAALSEADLLKIHGVGPKAVGVLRQALAARGLAFAERQPARKKRDN